MAATGGGGGAPTFSIRGYAARARAGAADEGDRCWPLGGEAGPLPPIEVRRFRWWADEAEAARDLVAEEEQEERRKAAMCRKRSVVELFAAVPRVGGEGRKVRRKLDNGNCKGKKDKAGPSSEIAARKKEKSGNMKAVSLSISQLFQDAIQKRKLKKSSSKKRKNQEVSVLLNKKNIKGSKKSVLSNQKVIKNSSEVQTILKKHSRTGEAAFLKNSDATCPSKSSLKSKHVTFSDADDICELTASHLKDNMEQSQVVQASPQPSERDSSQVVDDQRNTEEPHSVYQRTDAISETVEEDSSSLSEKVGSTCASHTVPFTNSKDKPLLHNSMDLNHRIEIFKRGNGNRQSSMNSAALSSQGLGQKFVDVDFPLQEGLYLGIAGQGEQNRRMVTQGSSTPAGLALDTRPGNLMRIPLPQPSSSCYVASLKEASDRNRSTILQERLTANCHLTEVHPSVPRSGNDMVSSINTSTGSNKSADAQTIDSVSACGNISFSGGYMGPPLNSHGEFVRVQPSSALNPDELLRKQCSGKDSLHPSTSPAFVTPNTCLDYSHLRINHQGQALPFFTVVNFGIQPDPYLTPKVPNAYSMDFRQHPSSERMEVHNYAIPSSNYSCSNQQHSSEQCSCAQCLGHENQLQKSLEMQSCFPRQNYEQNMQPAVETTMRLMGKTVSLGTGSKQCGGLDNWVPCSSKQIRAADHYFAGVRTQAFPQLFHGGLVDLPSRFGVSNGGRPPSGYVSCFSSAPAAEQGSVSRLSPVPAAEQGSGFSKSNHSQQPQVAVPNKLFVQPVSRYNEVGLGHQRPAVANQVQRVQSTANHLQLGAMGCRRTPSVAAMSYYDPWDKFKNFVETTPRPSQSRFYPQNSNTAQRPPVSPIMSGYSVQSTPALTTPTKFTSLRPLPPSMVSSHVYSSEGAQPNGSAPFRPPGPLSSQQGEVNTPGGAISKDKIMKQAPIGSNLESSKQMDKSFQRPAVQDYVLPKKPCIAVGKNLNGSSHVYSSDGAQPNGSALFHPPGPLSSQPGKVNTPGGAISKDKSMKQAPIGSNLERSKQMDKSFQRPAGQDYVLPMKPCIAVGNNLNGSPHVYSSEGVQPNGCTPIHPPGPLSSQPGKVNAPGGAMSKDKSMEQAPIRSNLECSKYMDKSFPRPAGKDYVLPKKPCLSVGMNLNMSSLPGKGLESCGSRPYVGQPQYATVRLSSEPEVNLRVVNNGTPTPTAWTESVNSVGARPVKLKSGATHILQPCASASMDQEDSWPVHSVVQFEVENDSRTVVGSSKKTDLS